MRKWVVVIGCAWVLWEQQSYDVNNIPERNWNILEVHDTRAECEGGVGKAMDRMKQRNVNLVGEDTVVFKSGNARLRFRCFPDTLDPRERKK